MDLDTIQTFLGAALTHQVTQFTFAFSIAAFIHSGRMKKEIASQVSGITASIDGVTKALKDEILNQNSRIGSIEKRVEILEKGDKK
jgi:hypothetical protein